MTALPQRIQRQRRSGWHQPESTLYCGRTGRTPENIYSNPFEIGYYELGGHTREWSRNDVVMLFGQELDLLIAKLGLTPEQYFTPLMQYKHLACWCGLDQLCHVDILIDRMKLFIEPPIYQMEMIL